MNDYEFHTNLYTDMGEVYPLLIPQQSDGFYRFFEEPMLSFQDFLYDSKRDD